jgi:dihydroxy-acid dehydratase
LKTNAEIFPLPCQNNYRKSMEGEKMDWILLLIGVLLIVTLAAFFAGIIPYPYGWMVLLVLLILRALQNRTR